MKIFFKRIREMAEMTEKKTINIGKIEKKGGGKIYSKEEVKEMLKGYKQVKRLQEIPLRTWIRYEDQEKFKAGGLLLSMDEEKMLLLNGKVKWSVVIENLKRVWMQDVEKREENKRKNEMDIENGLNLLKKYKEGCIILLNSKEEKDETNRVFKMYKEGKLIRKHKNNY